jgi:hypothetical protein
LHSYGLVEGYDKLLVEGYDKLVVADIIVLLIKALRGIGAANNKLTHAHIKADDHNPGRRNSQDLWIGTPATSGHNGIGRPWTSGRGRVTHRACMLGPSPGATPP